VCQPRDSAGADQRGSKGRADVEGEAEARQDQEPRVKNISKINESLEHKVFENMNRGSHATQGVQESQGEVIMFFLPFLALQLGNISRTLVIRPDHGVLCI
jgi:hypothetical protein